MNVHEIIAQRRATRQYTDQPVTDEVLDRVINSALEAPSAFNSQMRDLYVIRDQAVKDKLTEDSGQKQFAAAPVVVVTVARVEQMPEDAVEIMGEERAATVAGWKKNATEQQLREAGLRDAMLAAAFHLIAAQAEGLATSPTTGWDGEKVKEAIGLGGREDRMVALVTAMGYPAETPEHPGRQADRRVDL